MKPSRAAVLEPNATEHKRIADGLKKAGLSVSKALSPEKLGREHLVVLGPGLKAANRVAKAVREAVPNALVMAAQKKGFKASWADAILPLPVSPNDLKVRLPELFGRSRNAALPTMRPGDAIVDPHTGFYTFAHFKEILFIEVKRARRYGFPLSIALLAFDQLGHTAGEGALFANLMGGLALAIRRSLRDTDYPVQYGADRVLLLMPHTDLFGAVVVAKRICDLVARSTLQHGDEVLRPTVSVGASAQNAGKSYSFSDLIRQAQSALEAAQQSGGNRVEIADANGP